MNKKYLLAALLASMAVGSASARDLLTPGDNIIAVGGHWVCKSSYPVAESPLGAFDQNPGTKYLNFGCLNTGVIVTPYMGATTVKSIQFATANDQEARDPSSVIIYGTNDAITSEDNSFGDQENWTKIAEFKLALPSERLTWSEIYPFENETSYTSYKIIFPTVKNPTSYMQIGDIQMYEKADPNPEEGDISIFMSEDGLAVQEKSATDSSYATGDWDGSKPSNAIDKNLTTRYGNLAKTDVGLAVVPSVGLSTIESMTFTTFTNYPCCDPASYSLFGTMDALVSADNSMGDKENWVLIQEGSLNLPLARSAKSDPIAINATEPYKAYKILFNSLRDPSDTNATLVHIAEMQFDGIAHEVPVGDPILTPGDLAIPFHPTKDILYTSYRTSSYPEGEAPAKGIDGETSTKYLNFSGTGSGFIVTPSASSTVVAAKFWTANDVPDRDPLTFSIYGTNDEITTPDNGNELAENWIEIASGDTGLTTDRFAEGPLVTFANTAAYKSYLVVFPRLRNDGQSIMQVSEVQLYSDAEGTKGILAADNPAIAVNPKVFWGTHMGMTESSQHAIDGNTGSKYYNGCGAGSGIIFEPVITKSIAKALELTTANDAASNPGRNPTSYALYGTNEKVVSEDFSHGDAENWTLIAEGECELPAANKVKVVVEFENETPYKAYKLNFPTLQSETSGLQIAEIQILGDVLEAAPKNLINAETDTFLAICENLRATSKYNTNPVESPAMGLDQDIDTKYYNQANVTNNIGFIVTPKVGARKIQAIDMWTANDAEERDPTSYILYGTNDEITSEDNSDGSNENWIKVAEGAIELPAERKTAGTQIYFDTPIPAYTSWKMVFPTNKDPKQESGVQFSDVQFYDENFEPFFGMDPENPDTALAVANMAFGSSYPAQEGPFALADGDIKVKYLNFGKAGTGFIVTPEVSEIPVNALRFVSANDAQERDAVNYVFYGTDEEITSLDNSSGKEQNWTLISEGTLNLRHADTEYDPGYFRFRNYDLVTFENDVVFKSYKIVIPEVRNMETANSFQCAEVYFLNVDAEPTPVESPELAYSVDAEGNLVLRWAVSAGASLEVAPTAVGPWTLAGEPVIESGVMTYTVKPTAESGYYRLVCTRLGFPLILTTK